MAEEAADNTEKKFPIKAVAVMGAILLVEAIAITAAFMLSGGPAEVTADDGASELMVDESEQLKETLIVADRFQNTRKGPAYIYDTEVYITVRNKYLPEVEAKVEEMRARIISDVAAVIAAADPAQLEDPNRSIIRRQIKVALDKRLGLEDGESKIEEILIPKCSRFEADF